MALDRLTKITGPGIKTDTNWVGNNANFTGITTTASSFNVGVTTIHSNLAELHNIKSTGIVTATGGSFSGNVSAVDGSFSGNVTAVDGTFSGNVSIAGTLTYEDVTNIDAVGIITAPALDVDDFLDVGSNIKLGNAGVITATSFVGDGSGLTGVASTDNIVTGTAATFTGGVDINSDLDVDGHTNLDNVSIAGVATFADNKPAYFGTDGDFYINHSGSSLGMLNTTGNTLFRNTGGAQYFDCNQISLRIAAGSQTMLNAAPSGVTLYTSNNAKLATTNSGVSLPQDLDVDGHTNLDNVSIAGVSTFTGAVNATNAVVGDFIDVGSNIKIGNAGVVTATSFVGDGSGLTGLVSDKIFEGNTKAEVVDTGSNGYFIVETEGTERFRLDNVGDATFTGNLYIPDELVHSGDTNTRIRFPSSDTITAETAGTERLRITSTGEVKIMNTSGTVGLYFQSSSGAVSNFRAIGTNNQSLGYFSGNSERVRFSSDGKVGINTDDARFNNASNIASASFYHNDPKFGVYGSMVIGNLSATATDERQLAFYRRGGPAPGTPMSTHKMGRIAWYGSSNDTSLPDLAGSIECVPNGGGWTAGSNRRGSITFNNHEKETVRINSAGYVGINTNNPQRPLVISTSANTGAEFNIPDPFNGLSLNIYNRTTTAYHPLSLNASDVRLGINGAEKSRLDNNGNWCVGITGGSAKLHTKGDQSGGLIKCDAAEGTSRFFVTGNDSNACEVNLYDGAGSQKGILKAESDGMSVKSAGTPSQLQFFTTVTGGSSTRRLLIDDYGATQIERGSNGWSTLYHKTNNGGTRYHYRQASTGASGTTINLMRIRRHYWGAGNYKISTRQTYYNGSFESVHFISGHAANGNTTSFNINYVNVNGGNSSQIQKTATSHSSPGNNYAGWIDVFISIGAYEYYDIIIEASAMAQYSQDINNLGNDAYALHAV